MSAAAWPRWIRLTGTRLWSSREAAVWRPLRQLFQFSGTSYRSLSASARHTLSEPARPGLWVRQFATTDQQATKQQQQGTKPHLYLVLDDHEHAFTIHKLDMDDDLDDGGSAETPLFFPKPPLLRLRHQTVPPGARFAAVGSHIVAACPSTRGTVTFDTKTAKLIRSKVYPEGLLMGYDAAIAVEDTLYALESFTDNSDGSDGTQFPGGLHCLTADPYNVERPSAWQPLSNSSELCWSWIERPPELPFDAKTITAHAVHPRTGTIFVSATLGRVRQDASPSNNGPFARGVLGQGTYSYATRGSGQWKRHGDWLLPFKGHAHYDDELDAWVGLHHDSAMSKDDTYGHLCVSSVVSRQQQLNWKVGSEMLSLKHPLWRHVDAKLVHMPEHNKYCLVERLVPESADVMNQMLCRKKYVLRLMMFVVKYGEDGELKIMVHQPARFYKAPSYLCCFDIQAFWI